MPDLATESQTTSAREAASARRRSPRRGRRMLVRILAIVVILAAVAVGSAFAWKHFSAYESTDDAQIDGHINAISARINGYVTDVLVDDERFVESRRRAGPHRPRRLRRGSRQRAGRSGRRRSFLAEFPHRCPHHLHHREQPVEERAFRPPGCDRRAARR